MYRSTTVLGLVVLVLSMVSSVYAQVNSSSSSSTTSSSAVSTSSSGDNSSSSSTSTSSSSSSSSTSTSGNSSSSSSSSTSSSAEETIKCCTYRIQQPEDTSCEALDKAQCEVNYTVGTEGSPDVFMCLWNEGSCLNIFDHFCPVADDCTYSERHFVTSSNLSITSTLPSECYGENATIVNQYCGHGSEEMCEQYIDQVFDFGSDLETGSACIELESNACNVFDDPARALSYAQSLCAELEQQFGSDYDISISGNQCQGIMTGYGRPLPEFNTPVSICLDDNGTAITYPSCSELNCTIPQIGENAECEGTSGEIVSMECCPVHGSGNVIVGEDGELSFEETVIGAEFAEGCSS